MSVHALNPHWDGDKCMCSVRISGHAGRSAAQKPRDLTCPTCYLRTLREWQKVEPGINPDPRSWSGWPWEDIRWEHRETNV